MKVLSYSSLYFVSLPNGPMMLQGEDIQGAPGLALPIFQHASIAQEWVQHHQFGVPIGAVPIRDDKLLRIVLEEAERSGCEWVVWDRRPTDISGELQKISDLISSLQTDPSSN